MPEKVTKIVLNEALQFPALLYGKTTSDVLYVYNAHVPPPTGNDPLVSVGVALIETFNAKLAVG